ncbi:hypothetical protein ACPV3A_17110 [Paenibacillus sp. Dod16]|uniref:hypothetical protein n=1 Tax=Paenibacillus sp. Dod16 TaxID=3416392 RepID=UPI003CF3EA7D
MESIHYEATMYDLVQELERNSAYLLDHIFTNLASESVDVTIHIQGRVFMIPDIYDISAFENDLPYLYFIPSRFVSTEAILNTNIADMVQVYALPQDQVKLTLVKREKPYRDELEIKINSLSS